MKALMVGHRGVGKSTLMRALSENQPLSQKIIVHDLDDELVKSFSKSSGVVWDSVSDVFRHLGEAEFRNLESLVLSDLIHQYDAQTEQNVLIALGAGARLPHIGSDWSVIWVRRPSDESGRVFFDRPKLDSDKSDLEEFFTRKFQRDVMFQQNSTCHFFLEEGSFYDPELLTSLFYKVYLNEVSNLDAYVTLLPSFFCRPGGFARWWKIRKNWGYLKLEIRDDLLSFSQINEVLRLVEHSKLLFSFRDPEKRETSTRFVDDHHLDYDWPIDFGKTLLKKEPMILSWHPTSESSVDDFQSFQDKLNFEQASSLIKVATPISNFKNLLAWDKWQQQDPLRRAFFPMSQDGRWQWFRLHRSKSQAINFIREDLGSSTDQPTLYQWMAAKLFNGLGQSFGAVIGSPVDKSFSPVFHRDFFSKKLSSRFYSIKVDAGDLLKEALDVLYEFGLRWAAVTSPLKEAILNLSNVSNLSDYPAVNTLMWNESTKTWLATNTDEYGVEASLLSAKKILSFDNKDVAVWGGGGTLGPLAKYLEGAVFYSARSALPRIESNPSTQNPKVVVWAAGYIASNKPSEFSLKRWKPKLVLDLMYQEDSPGRVYAKTCGASYLSGLDFFVAQATKQQEYWSKQV